MERLENLYQRSQAGQWALADLPWSVETTLPPAMRPAAARLLSQVLFGEQASHAIVGQLLEATEDGLARRFLADQQADETRHVAVFGRYIEMLDQPVQPAGSSLAEMVARMQALPTVAEKLVGMHILIEGMALELFHALATGLDDPLLQALLRRVFLDESRHVAFGLTHTRHVLADLDREALHRVATEGGRYAALSVSMIAQTRPDAVALGLDLANVQARTLRVLYRRLGQVGLLNALTLF